MSGSAPELSPVVAASVGALLLAGLVAPATAVPTTATAASQEETCSQTFEMDGPRLYLPAIENATVSGQHDWPADANATVEVRFPDDPSAPVLRNDSVAIEDDRWTATVDLSTVEDGRALVARLERDGQVVDTVEGEVGSATAAVTFENQTVSTSAATLTVRRVHLDLGGFVAIHNESWVGPIVGVSNYLSPGTHENVTVTLERLRPGSTRLVAMAHRDSDCDEEFELIIRQEDLPYNTSTPSNPGAETATVQFSTPTPSPSPTATPTPSPTPTSRRSDGPTTSAIGTDTTAPGAGIGVALVALTSGMYLLWRKR